MPQMSAVPQPAEEPKKYVLTHEQTTTTTASNNRHNPIARPPQLSLPSLSYDAIQFMKQHMNDTGKK